jgi:hypothetical protein
VMRGLADQQSPPNRITARIGHRVGPLSSGENHRVRLGDTAVACQEQKNENSFHAVAERKGERWLALQELRNCLAASRASHSLDRKLGGVISMAVLIDSAASQPHYQCCNQYRNCFKNHEVAGSQAIHNPDARGGPG